MSLHHLEQGKQKLVPVKSEIRTPILPFIPAQNVVLPRAARSGKELQDS